MLESDQESWIELVVVPIQDESLRRGMGKTWFVDQFRSQRIVDVGNRNDPGAERNRFGGEPVRVAGAVETLVVMLADLDGHLQERQRCTVLPGHGGEDISADDGMGFHHGSLLSVESAGL